MNSAPTHGGDLAFAVNTFGGSRDAWVDLSTGINPTPYPFELPRAEAWTRLPDDDAQAALRGAAANAYGVDPGSTVVVAGGTQSIIQALPYCRPAGNVAVVGFTYAEHALAWRRGGHRVCTVPTLEAAMQADVVVLTNPNNPDGCTHTSDQLLMAATVLRKRDGLLVVDEAFADVCPRVSVAGTTNMTNLIVTRSFGKFYGLAGVRIGFAITHRTLARHLRAQLGPWPAAGPAMAVATEALNDTHWQSNQRQQLAASSEALHAVLHRHRLRIRGSTALFTLTERADANALWRHLAERHILTRRFDERPSWLRFGLAANDETLSRLDHALAEYGG